MRTFDKVIEVGSPKTGTTSLGHAFEVLGLRHLGWSPQLHQDLLRAVGVTRTLEVLRFPVEELDAIMDARWRDGAFDHILETMRSYDAFEDGPWHFPGFFKVVDRAFPNSRFILLDRDDDEWLASHGRHFGSDARGSAAHEDGSDAPRSAILEERSRRYRVVKEYFAARPGDLLSMNVCAGEGWERLCRFLDLPDPGVPFPHLNRSPLRKRLSARLVGGLWRDGDS